MTMRLVDFTVHDDKIVMTRKILSIEQYRDERARDLATKHFLSSREDAVAPNSPRGLPVSAS